MQKSKNQGLESGRCAWLLLSLFGLFRPQFGCSARMGTHQDFEQYESGRRHGLAGSSNCGWGALNVVTDGSYIREHYQDLCFAAFILECKCSVGHVVGAFTDASIKANTFHGELLGLMAVHLLLLAVNTVFPNWPIVRVYSDCLGALS
jgi:hypothetical protein